MGTELRARRSVVICAQIYLLGCLLGQRLQVCRNEMGRFRMHPLLRQLAQEKLNTPHMMAIAGQTLQYHSNNFAHFIQSFERDLQHGIGQEALQIILPEQANLRAAWQHAIQTGHWRTIADCLAGVHYFYKRNGFFLVHAFFVAESKPLTGRRNQ